MYFKIENNLKVPYSLEQLKKDHSDVSFPDPISKKTLEKFGVFFENSTPPGKRSKQVTIELGKLRIHLLEYQTGVIEVINEHIDAIEDPLLRDKIRTQWEYFYEVPIDSELSMFLKENIGIDLKQMINSIGGSVKWHRS